MTKPAPSSAAAGSKQRLERLILLLVSGAVLAAWGLLVALSMAERDYALERASSQLANTIGNLADFNELADLAEGVADLRSRDQRQAAIWRALLMYPSASIWVESDEGIAGMPPGDVLDDDAIVVIDARDNFIVQASMPRAEVLADWRTSTMRRTIALLVASIAFLILTRLLLGTLRQRAHAEQETASALQREAQLALHKVELEQTVVRRTTELRDANKRLGQELVERRAAEAELKEHDALLHAVAKGAEELLGSHSHEQAIASVLELVGQTIGVSRVHVHEITTDKAGHMRSGIRHEWCAPETTPLIDHPAVQAMDLTSGMPRATAPLLVGTPATFTADSLGGTLRKLYEDNGLNSFLQIPMHAGDKLWGAIQFIDASVTEREWSWAETDTLQTLAGLMGAAITRARYVRELADANMIVQNSPTILYRVRGEPPFPLIYVSHNIRKFGHDADALIASTNWTQLLVDPADADKMVESMARCLNKEVTGANIEFRLRTGDNDIRWVENRYTAVRDRHGRLVEIEGMIIDVTERKAAEDKIAQMARTDQLTGLANRATFIERLRQAYAASQRGANPFAILYMDLDRFKAINDTLGHPVGDALLREVADRLRKATRESDVVARLGGDEFAVLQSEISEPANAGALASTIQQAMARPLNIDGNDLHITTSIGICPYVPDSTGPDQMLAQADLALYRAKEEGRDCYRFHSDDLDQLVQDRVMLADELRDAIEQEQLTIHYQPQVELSSGRIVGVEAFVRWNHPQRGLLNAAEFIPVAEKTGAIVALGQWVLNKVCSQISSWREQGVKPPTVTMNLSFAQLKNGRELISDVRGAIEKWGLNATDLSFDVTEATLAQITLMRNDVLTELRRLGVQLAIDDFGSAYSSFDYLRTYKVNHLKITPSFLHGANSDPEQAATVRAIVTLARELGIGVVTEGIETEEQLDQSATTSIIAQGIFFSDPVGADEAGVLLREGSIPDKRSITEHEVDETLSDGPSTAPRRRRKEAR